MAGKVQIVLLLMLWCSHHTLNFYVEEKEQYKSKGYGQSPIDPSAITSAITKDNKTNTESEDNGLSDQVVAGGHFETLKTSDAIGSHQDGKVEHLKLKWKQGLKHPGHEMQRWPASGKYNSCPFNCQCDTNNHNQVTAVDCSGRGLTSIPKLPPTTLQAFLQNNDIRSVPCYIFSPLSHLKTLDLSGNILDQLKNCSFHGLISLENMKIANSDLSSLLSGVLDPFLALQKLDLSLNRLTSLNNQPFVALGNLKTLDISGNLLSHIKNEIFRGLTSLTFLSLQSNQLQYLPLTFEPEAFSHLTSLETLKLQGNQPYFAEKFVLYPDLALSSLTNLRHLSLDGYSYPLGQGFASLSNLTSLAFHDTDSYCDLSQVPRDFFLNINTRQPLDISLKDCNIVNPLPPEIFEHVPTINGLDLVYNHMGFDAFENSSYSLRNSNLTFLDIHGIYEINEEEIIIKPTNFKNLKNTKLRKLIVIHNDISFVSPLAIADLPSSLEYVDFSHNRIVHTAFLGSFLPLTNLRVLRLSKQVHYNKEFHFEGLRENKSIKRGASKHSDVSKFYPKKEKIRNVMSSKTSRLSEAVGDFCGNSKSSVFEVSAAKAQIWPIPMHLQEFYGSDFNLKYDNFVLTVVNNKVLKILDLSRNEFICLGGPIQGLPQLEYLDLSSISCFRMSNVIFSDMASLKTLLLNNNWLGQSLVDDISGLTFSTLAKLENLNLHNNGIEELADMTFTFNSEIQTINLSRNELSYFQPTLANNVKLTVLDLSSNSVRGFTKTNCQEFAKIKRHNSKFQMFISDNKFLCSCDNLPFLMLLLEQPDIFADVGLFQCQLRNGSYLAYSKLDSFISVLGFQCLTESLFGVILFFFTLLILSISIASVYYYKRWQMKYLYHLARLRLRMDALDFRDGPHAQVFITYDLDAPFYRNLIHDKFLPQLRHAEVPVVLGEIDFLPGPVAASIAKAVTNTKKTLIVLSKNIFEEPERIMEINFAIMHELYLRRQILVPVLHFGPMPAPLEQGGIPGVNQREVELAEMYTIHGHEVWDQDMGFPGYTDEEWTLICDLLDAFPPEISCYLYGQVHRCMIFDGGTPHFWECLIHALLIDD